MKRSPNNSVMTKLKTQMVDLNAGGRGMIYVAQNFTAKPGKQMKKPLPCGAAETCKSC